MSNISDVEKSLPVRGRKRERRKAEWKKNVAKRKRNAGKAYISPHSNRLIAARVVGPQCSDGCFTKVTRKGVDAIFKAFWDIEDYGLQNAYLQKLFDVMNIKRKRTKEVVSRRSSTILYYVRYNNQTYRVCKKGFCSMHGISRSRVASAIRKLTCTGSPTADKRGRNKPPNKIVGVTAERVREHVRLLPALTSRYCSAKSPHQRYLGSSLTTGKLYDLYIKWMTENHPTEKQVSFHYYRDVLKEFKNSFEPPRTDTCDLYNTARLAEYSARLSTATDGSSCLDEVTVKTEPTDAYMGCNSENPNQYSARLSPAKDGSLCLDKVTVKTEPTDAYAGCSTEENPDQVTAKEELVYKEEELIPDFNMEVENEKVPPTDACRDQVIDPLGVSSVEIPHSSSTKRKEPRQYTHHLSKQSSHHIQSNVQGIFQSKAASAEEYMNTQEPMIDKVQENIMSTNEETQQEGVTSIHRRREKTQMILHWITRNQVIIQLTTVNSQNRCCHNHLRKDRRRM